MPTSPEHRKRGAYLEVLHNIRKYEAEAFGWIKQATSPEAKGAFLIAAGLLSLAEVAALELLFKQEEGT